MIIAQVVTVAAAAIAMQAVLPAIWSGFQIVGGDPAITSLTGATNAIVLGLIVLTITTVINSLAVKVMAVVNAAGVTAELIGATLLIIALFSTAQRGPGIVLNTEGLAGGFGAMLAAALMAAYVLVGFDSAGELSEETHNPRRTAPRTILRALIASGIGGALLILAALMAAPAIDDQISTGGLAWIVTSRLGDVWGRVFLANVVFAAFVCTLTIQTATTRMIYSMSRDEVLPFAKHLRKVSPKGGATVHAAVLVGVLSTGLLLVNLGHAGLFTALTSTCIVLLYLAYLCVTAPLLYRRLKGWPRDLGEQLDEGGRPVFSLGRWGLLINIFAVAYGLAMAINLAWPRQSIYDPAGTSPVLQYFALIVLAITGIGGLIAFTVKKQDYRRAIGVLPASAPTIPIEADAVTA
jgi:urea carboxylase system permease